MNSFIAVQITLFIFVFLAVFIGLVETEFHKF